MAYSALARSGTPTMSIRLPALPITLSARVAYSLSARGHDAGRNRCTGDVVLYGDLRSALALSAARLCRINTFEVAPSALVASLILAPGQGRPACDLAPTAEQAGKHGLLLAHLLRRGRRRLRNRASARRLCLHTAVVIHRRRAHRHCVFLRLGLDKWVEPIVGEHKWMGACLRRQRTRPLI